ncbi:MAG: ABC transporter permease [Lachnospiraceae bacterium]|nr:ABC transporter permease [Lachnospiraceae bacterium]
MRELINRHKRYIICIVCVLGIFAGNIYKSGLVGAISMQNPEKRWSADKSGSGYAAAYMSEDEGLNLESIKSFKEQYRTTMLEDSLEIAETSRNYIDAYSCEGQLEVSKEAGKGGVKVNVTAVGGDFFFFHPMELLSGSYINDSDLMHDRIVVDEDTAWNLYGSSEIAGKSCVINNKYYYIAGVVRVNDSKISERTYGNRSRIFMHYDEYPVTGDVAKAITNYEMVYPELLSGKAVKVLNSLLGIEETNDSVEGAVEDARSIEVVDMNRRFGFVALWNVIRSYGERSSRTNGIIYPFWENECRMTEDYAAIALALNILFAAIAAIMLIPTIVFIYKFAVGNVEKLIRKIRSR